MSDFIMTITFPSAILTDFHTYLDYCETNRPKVTKKNEFLNRKDLFALNAQMLQKNANATTRLDQNFYLQLHLFYHLCFEGRLFRINREKATASHWEVLPEKLKYFRGLNHTEQYFYLFKTLWCYCNWSNLQIEPSRSYTPTVLHTLFLRVAKSSLPTFSLIKDNDYHIPMIGRELGVSLFHLELFGFWKCQWKKGEYYREKTRPQVELLTLTEFGIAIAKAIALHGRMSNWNKYYKGEAGLDESFKMRRKVEQLMKAGKSEKKAIKIVKKKLAAKKQSVKEIPFEELFQDLFSEGALGILNIRSTKRILSGTYTFRVNLTHRKRIWRRIQLDAKATLEDLHIMIQRAFNFGNDHLYAFYMDGKRFSELAYNDSRGGDGPFADEITLGACEELEINRKIFYLFDFGTEWHFDVVLESIEEQAALLKKGKIIESKGEAPKQYGGW